MGRYKVTVQRTVEYAVELDAEDEAEAQTEAISHATMYFRGPHRDEKLRATSARPFQ
jgi:hypothetical protein